jgi:hypothetical protein
VTTMDYMLDFATSFNRDVAAWDVARVVNMNSVFSVTMSFNRNIGKWNVASVTNMSNLFTDTSFNQNIASWNVERVTTFADAFSSTTALSDCNKMAIYNSWGVTLRTAYPGFGTTSVGVSSFWPLNAQLSGGATITVLGVDFGCADVSPSAYLSGKPCATTTWTSGTQLVCAADVPVFVGASPDREAWVKVFADTASRGFTFDGTFLAVWRRIGR